MIVRVISQDFQPIYYIECTAVPRKGEYVWLDPEGGQVFKVTMVSYRTAEPRGYSPTISVEAVEARRRPWWKL